MGPLARIALALVAALVTASTVPAAGAPVVVARVDQPIHPVIAQYLAQTIDEAAATGAQAVLVELDTPGGSLQSTREIVRGFLGAPVPVVVHVAPGGAQAASAGFFLLLGADVAAMAPETNTGAAHPVAGGGQDIEGAMGDKVEQDTLAFIRSLAERHGRDLELAEAAVRESRSYTAGEALESGLIDVVAATRAELLRQLDGRTIERPSLAGGSARLATADAPLVERPMPVFQRVLAAIAHPEVAGLLMALGMLGLYVEISNPGLILPGTLGGISVILGLFALSVLPVNAAGLALVGLALVLFVAELQVPTFGALTLGGVISLALGLMMLFEDADPTLRLEWWWVAGIVALIAPIIAYTSFTTVRMRRQEPTTGAEGMVGEVGRVHTALEASESAAEPADTACSGRVFVHGELWTAVGPEPIAVGAEARVVAVDGLRLRVEPVAASADESTEESSTSSQESPAWS